MALYGQLSTMSLMDLLQWAGINRKTGVFELERNKITKKLLFRSGRVVACYCDDPQSRLGQFLLSRGKVTQEQLRDALSRQEATGESIGSILQDAGIVTQDELTQLMSQKAEEMILGLFDWTEAIFRFTEQGSLGPYVIEVDLSVDDILLKGLQRVDELSIIRQSFHSSGIVMEPTGKPMPPEVDKSAMARRIVNFIDGQRPLAEVLLHANASEFLVLKFLYNLFNRGVIRIAEVLDTGEETITIVDPWRSEPQVDADGASELAERGDLPSWSPPEQLEVEDTDEATEAEPVESSIAGQHEAVGEDATAPRAEEGVHVPTEASGPALIGDDSLESEADGAEETAGSAEAISNKDRSVDDPRLEGGAIPIDPTLSAFDAAVSQAGQEAEAALADVEPEPLDLEVSGGEEPADAATDGDGNPIDTATASTTATETESTDQPEQDAHVDAEALLAEVDAAAGLLDASNGPATPAYEPESVTDESVFDFSADEMEQAARPDGEATEIEPTPDLDAATEAVRQLAIEMEETLTIVPWRDEARGGAGVSGAGSEEDARVDLEQGLATAQGLLESSEVGGALKVLNKCYVDHPDDERLKAMLQQAEAAYIAQAAERGLAPGAVPRQTGEQPEMGSIPPQSSYLLSMVDGVSDIRALSWLAPMRQVEVLRILDRLLQSGWIEIDGSASSSSAVDPAEAAAE